MNGRNRVEDRREGAAQHCQRVNALKALHRVQHVKAARAY
jgi:hypothetical protein